MIEKTRIVWCVVLPVMMILACHSFRSNPETQVVSIEKQVDTESADHKFCSDLTLNEKQVVEYFRTAVEVDEYEFNSDAMITPCKYIGKLKIDSNLYHWEIYAGGAGYLYNDSAVNKRYLCKEACSKVLPDLP